MQPDPDGGEVGRVPVLSAPLRSGLTLRVCRLSRHLWVHFRRGPVTCSPSRGWLCQLASSASFPPRMQPKLRGTLTPVDCLPTEYVSFHWTHFSTSMRRRCPAGGHGMPEEWSNPKACLRLARAQGPLSRKPAFTERVCVLDYRTYLVFENKGLRVFGNAGVL